MITFVTLGPEGTDHDHTLQKYMAVQGVSDARVELVPDLLDGLETVRADADSFLLQNSCHPDVAEVTERYWREVAVLDTFVAPTKTMAILRRHDAPPRPTLTLMPATVGYVDRSAWADFEFVRAKPLVGAGLVSGAYQAGLTHLDWATRHPDVLSVVEVIGPVDTAWILFGQRRVNTNGLRLRRRPDLFAQVAPPVGATT